MLQDLERGRPMEIDALVTAVQELGRLAEVPTPAIDTVLALVRQRARLAGCYVSLRGKLLPFVGRGGAGSSPSLSAYRSLSPDRFDRPHHAGRSC